jgi:nitroreductase
MDFEQVVRKRRMFRNFQPRPVAIDTLTRILETAQHSPSAGYSQGWAYVVITDPVVRKKIGQIQGEDDFYASKRFHKFVSEAPALIVACTCEELYHERYREADKLKENGTEIEWPIPYWYFDIGCSCMLIFLASVNEGLASAFTGVFRTNELRQLLGIPAKFHPVGVISIGHPNKDIKSPSLKRGRRATNEVVHYEHW